MCGVLCELTTGSPLFMFTSGNNTVLNCGSTNSKVTPPHCCPLMFILEKLKGLLDLKCYDSEANDTVSRAIVSFEKMYDCQ